MRINIKMILLIFLAGFALNVVNCNVVAGYDGSRNRNMPRERGWPYAGRHFVVNHRGRTYFYHSGLFFRKSGIKFVVVAPPIGAIVPVLPFGFVTFMFGPGIVYYYLDGVYYKPVPEGYVVVPESEFEKYKQQKETLKKEESDKNVSGEEYVVNIPNSDGTFTPVKLKKSNNGYIGPQGEFYEGHPSVEQLRVLYGK